MGKFVEINSNVTIAVTAGLEAIDHTDKKSHVPDRLNAKAAWVDTRVVILQGLHWYPAEIAEYNTVKTLNKEGQLTIGAFADTCPDQEKVEALRNELLEALATYYTVAKKNASKKPAVEEED